MRLRDLLLIALAALSPFVFLSALRGLPNYLEADHRLAPTFALVHGYRVYYPPDFGPVLSSIYGPVTVLTYLPVTIASTPVTAILMGTLLTLLIFYGTALLTIRAAAGKTWMKWWQLFGLTAGTVWLVGPVEQTSEHIHADAPALAFAALAVCFAVRERHRVTVWENAVLSGFFAVLSVFAKQNMAPLLVGLAFWAALRAGWKGLGAFFASVALFGGATIAITLALMGSAEAFYFNCVYMPLHQPFDKTLFFPTLMHLLSLSLMLLVIPTASILQSWLRWNGGLRDFLIAQRTFLLVLAGILMTPASILGRLKLGGSENSLGLSLFFFVLALLAEVSAHRESDFAEHASAVERLATLILLFACLIGLSWAVYSSARNRPESPIQRAFEYSRQHPGKVYFPQFPLAQLMAEGKLYHFSWGLTDRRNAGWPVSDAHFHANIPVSAEAVAITGFVPSFEMDMTARQGSRLANFQDAAQLPRFEFFAVPRSESQQKQ